MLAGALETRRQPQKFLFIPVFQRQHGDQFWLAFGERARLVNDQRVDLAHHLDRFGVLEQHARGRAFAHRHHDRHRRRQAQRARAGDDQDSDGIDQRMSQARLWAYCCPQRKRDHRGRDDYWDKITGDHVREFLNRGATALGVSDHLHDLREQGFRADPFGAHDERARAIDGRADHAIAGVLFHRNRFASHHRFIDGARAFDHGSINRNFFAGTHAQEIAGLRLIQRNVFFRAIFAHSSGCLSARGQARL